MLGFLSSIAKKKPKTNQTKSVGAKIQNQTTEKERDPLLTSFCGFLGTCKCTSVSHKWPKLSMLVVPINCLVFSESGQHQSHVNMDRYTQRHPPACSLGSRCGGLLPACSAIVYASLILAVSECQFCYILL